jgi:TonB family protein
MRVLVVDQDSASNETIVRSLREHYVVDAVTNKGDSLDLLRSNTFEVIVAGERLEDGSGLELLGQISKKYPSILRIFAADRHRLKLLKGRLGPFELFQTLAYPIDPERLLATLMLADAAQDAHADTSNIQHVVLSGSLESEEPEAFPAPEPEPRAIPVPDPQHAPRPVSGKRPSVAHDGAPQRARTGPGQRSRRTAGAGSPSTRAALGASPARTGAPPAPRSPSAVSPHRHGRTRSGTNKVPPVRFPPLEPPQATSSASSSLAETAALARAARDNLDDSPNDLDYKRIAVLVGTGAVIVVGVIVLGFELFGSRSEAPRQAAAPIVQAPEYSPEVTDLIAQTESALSADDYKAARADVDKLHQLAPSHPRLAFFESLLAQKSAASKNATADAAHGGSGARGSGKRGSQGARKSGGGTDDDKSSGTAGGVGSGSVASSGSAADRARGPASVGARASTGSSDASPATQSVSGFAPETPAGLSRPSTAGAVASTADSTAQHAAPDQEVSASRPSASTALTGSGPGSGGGTASAGGSGSGGGAAFAGGPGSGGGTASAGGAGSGGGTAFAGGPGSGGGAASAGGAGSGGGTAFAGGPGSGGGTASAGSTPSPTSSSTRGASSDEPPPVVREAKLVRRVNPDYPSAAKKEGITGFVDLQVTVSQDGLVKDATVLNSNPPDVFDKAALAAVRRWKYDPRFVDGLPSEAELKVHLDFQPGQ